MPADAVAAVVEECGRKQVYGVVILSAGFAEAGPDGEALEAEVLRTARSWGIRLVGPNCLGLINTHDDVRLHASFADIPTRPGRLSLLSESGMLGAVLVTTVHEAGLGLSSFLALGNRADVSGNDLLQYWEADDTTEVVGMYIESFGNPRNFSRLARRLTRVKPVVAVKARRLPTSTARSGMPPRTRSCARPGVLRVPTLSALVDTARLLLDQPLPAGPRVAVLGNAGGSLAIAADAVLTAGLSSPPWRRRRSRRSRRRSRRRTSPARSISGPTRCARRRTGHRRPRRRPGVDALLVLYAEGLGATTDEAVAAVAHGRKVRREVPVVVCAYGPRRTRSAEVPVFDAVDVAADALGRVAAYAAYLARPEGEPLGLDEGRPRPRDSSSRSSSRPAAPSSGTSTRWRCSTPSGCGSCGPKGRRTWTRRSAAAASMGYPVVLKAAGRAPPPRRRPPGSRSTSKGPTRCGPRGSGWLTASVTASRPPSCSRWSPRVSTWRCASRPPHGRSGPVDRSGRGGGRPRSSADVRVLPLTDLDAARLVAGSRLAPTLDETNRAALEAALLRVAALIEEVPEVAELTLNPVIVRDGTAIVTQARASLGTVERDPLPPVRRA